MDNENDREYEERKIDDERDMKKRVIAMKKEHGIRGEDIIYFNIENREDVGRR